MISPVAWSQEKADKPASGLITDVECQMLRWAGRGTVVEIGAFAGCSTLCLAEKADVVHSFDKFIVDDISAPAYCPMLGLEKDYRGSFRHVFDENTKHAKNIVVHEGDAREGEWSEPIDVLFIDASCGESFQLALLKKFYPYVKDGGLLIHQDFFYYRSPVLPCLMARLFPAFRPVTNADTSMIYMRSSHELPREVSISIASQLPEELKRFGGVKEPGGAIIATQLIYWLLMNQKLDAASRLTIEITLAQRAKATWDNLRSAWSEYSLLHEKGFFAGQCETPTA